MVRFIDQHRETYGVESDLRPAADCSVHLFPVEGAAAGSDDAVGTDATR
jgi:hypothetical protein